MEGKWSKSFESDIDNQVDWANSEKELLTDINELGTGEIMCVCHLSCQNSLILYRVEEHFERHLVSETLIKNLVKNQSEFTQL